MSKSISYNDISGFSKLFKDFISGNSFFIEMFPSNYGLLPKENIISKKVENYKNRNKLHLLISETMRDLPLSDAQSNNLNKIFDLNTAAVVTGQQVGFLGGPNYTYLKVCSALSHAEKLSKIYTSFNFIPIFWVEDNDHDNFEASHVAVFDKNNDIIGINCDPTSKKTDRTIVSKRYFDSNILSIIENIINMLPDNEENNGILDSLRDIYLPNKSWSQAFIEFINYALGSKGILFVSATKARESGFFTELVIKEIENYGATKRFVESANNHLLNAGYHIQAKVSPINLFIQDGDNRLKFKMLSEDDELFEYNGIKLNRRDILDLAISNPSFFSPNVLLRPVFQDFTLPTVLYIAGPSEIGYLTQIREVYDFFNVDMPAIIPRHSATFVNSYVTKFLERNILELKFFMRNFSIIMQELSQKFISNKIENTFAVSERELINIYDNIINEALQIDKTLERSAKSALQKSLYELENIYKKIISANKRNHEIEFRRYLKTADFLFPNNTLQERIYSPLNFMVEFGVEKYNYIIFNAFENEPNEHYILY